MGNETARDGVYCVDCDVRCDWENTFRYGVRRCEDCWPKYKSRLGTTIAMLLLGHKGWSGDDYGITFEWGEIEDALKRLRNSEMRMLVLTDETLSHV